MLRGVVGHTGLQALAQCIHTAGTLLTVPILLNTLGPERLGVWFAALAVLALFGFFVYALGGAVISAVAHDTRQTQTDRISAAALLLAAAGSVIAVSLASVAGILMPWPAFIGQETDIRGGELTMLAMVLSVCLGFAALGEVPKSFLIGLKRGALASGIDSLAVLCAVLALVLAAASGQPLWVLALASVGLRGAINLVAGLAVLACRHDIGLRPSAFQLSTIERLFHDARSLSVSGAAHSVAHHTDTILVGALASLAGAGLYGIMARLFAFPGLLIGFLSLALWPYLSEADEAHLGGLVRQRFAALLTVCVIFSVLCAIALVLAAEPLLKLWTGQVMEPDLALVSGFGFWMVVASIMVPVADLYRALCRFRLLARLYLAVAAMNLSLSAILVLMMGPAGAVWGSVASGIFCFIVPASFVAWRSSAAGSPKADSVNSDEFVLAGRRGPA